MKSYYDRFWKGELDKDNPNVVQKTQEEELEKSRRESEEFTSKLMKMIGIKPSLSLDVGCGIGVEADVLSKYSKVIGIDISDEVLDIARKRYPNIEFRKEDVCSMSFEDSKFDFIISMSVIEHVLDTEAMFREFNRVLKMGGIIVLTSPEASFLKNAVVSMFYWDTFFHPENPHIRHYSKKTLRQTLLKYGFEPMHYESAIKVFGISTSMMMIAKKVKNLD